jgi:hypothetical protein
MDRLVCRRSSVLCSYDIVKRVVTVKQVRPSPLRRDEAGPGAWVCVPMREHRRGCRVRIGPRDQRSAIRDQKGKAPAAWPEVTPV